MQGPSGEQFVYINIGTYAGQTNTSWSRRLKTHSVRNHLGRNQFRENSWSLTFRAPGKTAAQVARMSGVSELGADWGWQLEAAPKHTRK